MDYKEGYRYKDTVLTPVEKYGSVNSYFVDLIDEEGTKLIWHTTGRSILLKDMDNAVSKNYSFTIQRMTRGKIYISHLKLV